MNRTGQTFPLVDCGAQSTKQTYPLHGTRGVRSAVSRLIYGVSVSTDDTSKQTEPALTPLSFTLFDPETKDSPVLSHDHLSDSFSHYVASWQKKPNPDEMISMAIAIGALITGWSCIKKSYSNHTSSNV